jgi:hypothetical protein
MKEIKLNKREIEVLKNALDNYKIAVQIKTSHENAMRKEMAINELYNIESVENKLKGDK